MGDVIKGRAGLEEKLKSDTRDVSDLWKDALKAYKGIVGFDLQRKFDSVDSLIAFSTDQMNNFHTFRHDNKKVDKLRTLFAENIDLIETGAQQLISAATPAFPPAAAIGTALTFLLQACRQQRADYDVVTVFFEDMQGFLKRITILETRLPKYKAYQNCLMEVFTSFLTMCGFAHKYIELGRFKKWISNLFKGTDGELGGARGDLNKKLENLQQATELAILGNTEETLKMASQLDENQRSHAMLLERVGERLDNIHENTEHIRDDVSKLLRLFGASNKPPQQPEKPVAKKPPSAGGVRHALPIVGNDDHEYRVLKETLIPDTCSWVFADPAWDAWLKTPDGARPVLAVTAPPGAGKSHIAASVHDRLAQVAREEDGQRSSVAHFYFREQENSFAWFLCGIVTVVNQVAETNGAICERFSAQIARDDVPMNVFKWQDIVKYLLGSVFERDSKHHLFLVLDGLDELRDFKSFEEFLQTWIVKEKLRISLVVTTRPSKLEALPEDMPLVKIEATKERQQEDLKTLIWHHINSHNNLRRFGRYAQQRIADTIQEASPNMLYAEHLLQRLDNIGREGAVLKALHQKKPEDLHGIYEILLAECQRRMPPAHQAVGASLLHWIAFSRTPLTVIQIASLLKELSSDKEFDIEEIPEFFSKFLRIGDPGYDSQLRAELEMSQKTEVYDLKQEPNSEDDLYSDGPLPVKFLERSMRHYFTEGSPGTSAFRWGPSEANRQIFLMCTRLSQPTRTDVEESLQHYCALYLLNHYIDIKRDQHDVSQQIEVMEAFAEVMSNKTNLSEMLRRSGMKYGSGSASNTNERVKEWAELLDKPEVKAGLSDFAATWWEGARSDPKSCRRGLAEGYLRDLYQSPDSEEANRAWKLLYGVLNATGLGFLLMNQASVNYPKALEAAKKDDQGEFQFEESLASLGIIGLFEANVKPDASAYRAAAEVLLEYDHVKEAEKTCREALERCQPSDVEFFRASCFLSDILLEERKKRDEALAIARKAADELAGRDIPPSLKRIVFTTKARAEAKLGHETAALQSFADAKAADPDGVTPGADLVDELTVLYECDNRPEYIRMLKSWNLLERITWLAWNYADDGEDRHSLFCDIAVDQGEEAFMVAFYKEVVEFLDNIGAGLPLRLDLALVYFEVCNDPARAVEELDKIFDSHAPALCFPITGVDSSWTMERAIDAMVNAQVALFRASHDPVFKAERLAALAGLMDRPFSLDVPRTSSFWTGQQRVGLAYMYLVVGPLSKFQETLQSLLDDCFAGLGDSVGWNDGPFLWILAQALALLSKALRDDEKLRRLARIVGSALFSKLSRADEAAEDAGKKGGDSGEGSDKKSAVEDASQMPSAEPDGANASDDDGDDNDENDDDVGSDTSEPPDDEGDLVDESYWSCGGFCSPAKVFSWWKDRSTYFYVTYSTGMICEECQEEYDRAQRGEVTKKRRHFHGASHDRLKLPVEGWRGITDGVLRVEGDEPIKVDDFFALLQEECRLGFQRLWGGV